MSTVKEQLTQISSFLDPHLFLHLLQKNGTHEGTNEAEALIQAIMTKLPMADEKASADKKAEAEKKAQKLLNILVKNKEREQLRKDMSFTLEALKGSEHAITIEDCQALFDYSKVLYEQRDYKKAENYLFNLKEILANESAQHNELIVQVFWGLLATSIINQKPREEIELRSLRKLKDKIKEKNGEHSLQALHQFQTILHWVLVASFCTQKSTGLFAALLADKVNFGDSFINIMKLTNQNLMRYMVASFLLGRSEYQPSPDNSRSLVIAKLPRNALPQIGLPIVLQEKENYSDGFTKFTEALFEDFDFDQAIQYAEELTKEAENDILLRPHAAELRRQALLYVFETETKLYKTGIDLTTFCDQHNINEVDSACREVKESLNNEGLIVNLSDGEMIGSKQGRVMQIQGNENNIQEVIEKKTMDLAKRTEGLISVYNNQIKYLETKSSQKPIP